MARKKKKGRVIKMGPPLGIKQYIRKYGRSLKLKEVLCVENILSVGKGNLFVAREKRNGDIIVGIYLVDVFCLGVKDTFFKEYTAYDYQAFKNYMFDQYPYKIESIDPNYGFNLIYGSVEYAEELGIEPYKDFNVTEYLLDDPESLDYIEIEFGEDGMPSYYSYDGDKKGEILRKLEKAVGIDGFMFTDGQPFLDLIDESDNLPSGYLDGIEDLLEEQDLLIFKEYATILEVIEELYEDNIDVLFNLFKNNHKKIIKSIQKILVVEETASHEDTFNEITLSIVEKYLMFQNTHFLTQERYVIGFETTDNESLFHIAAVFNLYSFGDEKLLNLITILHTVLNDLNGENPSPKSMNKLLEQFMEGEEVKDKLLFFILTFLSDHHLTFDPIDFEKFHSQIEIKN